MKDSSIKKWYAVSTKLKSEKIAEEELKARGVETYLPLEKRMRLVGGKRRWYEVPLITNYVFVKIDKAEVDIVKYTRGVKGFVSFAGEVPAIPETQISSLRILLEEEINYEMVNQKFLIGEKVKVISRNLKGVEGKLVQYRGKNKVLIEISAVQMGLLVDVPVKYLQKKAA